MNIGNITSNNFNLDGNGKDMQIEVYEQLIEQLQQENQELKEDISFCLHSIKQEMEMSTDSRTRNEMTSCYEILKRWNK